ncbi:MAG: translocation/assembly module TamB domain-containing protein [Actinomycetota bacterium]
MTNSPNSQNQPERRPSNRFWRPFLITGAGVGILTLGGLLGATWWVRTRLAPLVQTQISQLLLRPVQVGRLESFSPTGVRFGPSSLPATATDPDRAATQAVDARFSLLDLVFRRTLTLDITLINADAYIQQDPTGRWIQLKTAESKPGFLTTEVKAIRVNRAHVVLVPSPAVGQKTSAPIDLNVQGGTVQFRDRNQRILYDVAGQFTKGGNFKLKADSLLPTGETNVMVQGQNLLVPEVARLLKTPAIFLQAGLANGNVTVQLRENQLAKITGAANFQGVQAQLQGLKQPIQNAIGQVRFAGTKIGVDALNASLGQVPVQIGGVVQFGPNFDVAQTTLNLAAQVQPTNVAALLAVAQAELGQGVKLPVSVAAEVGVTAKLTGNLRSPLLSGAVATTKPAQVDRLPLSNISSNFNLNLASSQLLLSNIKVVPVAGGLIAGSGQIDFGAPLLKVELPRKPGEPAPPAKPAKQTPSGLVLDVQAQNLPAEAIAQQYAPDFVTQLSNRKIAIGNVSAQAQIFGPFNNLQGKIQWQAPQATYPASGELRIVKANAELQNVVLSLAGGTVAVNAALANRRWQATLDANQLALNRLESEFPLLSLPPQASLLLAGVGGRFSGQVRASGSLDNLATNAIAATGTGVVVPNAGGTVEVTGELTAGRWQAAIAPNQVPFQRFAQTLKTAVPLNLPPGIDGLLAGRVRLSGTLDNLTPQAVTGTGNGQLLLPNHGGTINASGQLNAGRWQATAGSDRLAFSSVTPALIAAGVISRPLPSAAEDALRGQVRLSGTLNNFAPSAIAGNGSGQLLLANGGGSANFTGSLSGGRWQADLASDRLAVSRLQPILLATKAVAKPFPSEFNGVLQGQARLSGTLDRLNLSAIAGNGSGQLLLPNGNGTATATASLSGGRWQADVTGSRLALNRLQPALIAVGALPKPLPPEVNGLLSGRARVSGSLENLTAKAINAIGSGQLQLVNGGGAIDATGELRNGNWQASVSSDRVSLPRFSKLLPEAQLAKALSAQGFLSETPSLPLLQGLLKGQVDLSGSLATFAPGAIAAKGRVQLSQVPVLNQPFAATFSWNGQRLQIQEATTPGLRANGFLAVNFPQNGLPSISNIDLNLNLQNFDLKSIPVPVPSAVAGNGKPVTGRADFIGRISGPLPRLTVAGDLRLQNFAINQIAFDPVLSGTVNAGLGQGLDVKLRGQQDRIEIALNPSFLPTSFLIRRGETFASGETQGEVLRASFQNFPLATLNLAPAKEYGLGTLTGRVSGQVNIARWQLPLNFASLQAQGQIAVAQPAIGHIKGDSFQAQFNYANGVATLANAEFRQKQSQYQLAGTLKTGDNPQFQGKVSVQQGNLQDVLTALQIFNLSDLTRGLKPPVYGTAADVQTVAVGLPNAPLIDQLRRLEEIQAILDQQQQRQAASKLPPLAKLQGQFNGAVAVAGSLQTGVQAQFNIQGAQWQWGSYVADQFSLEGSFENGTLTVLPLEIRSGKTLIGFSGQIGQRQSGQLRVENLPVEELANIVELPYVDVTGNLNLRAAIAGSLENPQATGELSLLNGTLNRQPIKQADGSFSYTNARLNFGGSALVTEAEPLQVQGSLPFALPFAKVKPDSDQIALTVNLKNEGLAIINVLTPEIAWVDGRGQVQLQVGGTLQRPVAEGLAVFENATLRARAFPDPLTGLQGRVRFEGDRLRVEGVQGQLSQGQVVAAGVLPLSSPLGEEDRDRANLLAVGLNQLTVNLKGLYRGGATGQVQVGGTALSPQLSGEIQLSNGQVFLAASGGGTQVAATPATTSTDTGTPSPVFEVGFNNLGLTLGRGVQVTSPPILSFQATGGLRINGTLDDLRPQGTIRLTSGSVNLFTTQFRLEPGYPQTATFVPSQGLDPTLDVRLLTSVPEVTRFLTPSSALPAEIADAPTTTNFGSVRTVRIQASVQGRASQLAENLELRSSPSRSEAEIVALLGGSFVQTLGQGDSTLAIANLAGAGLFSNIQSVITNATGLSEFRLFPARIQTEKNARSSSLGLGLEVGVDVTRNISASIVRILSSNQPTEFTLRYRLNDQTLLRGSTNFQGDNRATVEYELRF